MISARCATVLGRHPDGYGEPRQPVWYVSSWVVGFWAVGGGWVLDGGWVLLHAKEVREVSFLADWLAFGQVRSVRT